MLDEREAFLRAIFDSPDDDTPKLVFADWLDEHGEELLARLIRLDVSARQSDVVQAGAIRAEMMHVLKDAGSVRGWWAEFSEPTTRLILTTGDELEDGLLFRRRSVEERPGWFVQTYLRVDRGRIHSTAQFDTIFTAPASRRVTDLDLSGEEEAIPGVVTDAGGVVLRTEGYEFRLRPVVTSSGVAALAAHRGAHRLQVLDLTNNELDNDAARALVRSPYLDNLTELRLRDGNRLRGRVWQQVLERFGEDVAT